MNRLGCFVRCLKVRHEKVELTPPGGPPGQNSRAAGLSDPSPPRGSGGDGACHHERSP